MTRFPALVQWRRSIARPLREQLKCAKPIRMDLSNRELDNYCYFVDLYCKGFVFFHTLKPPHKYKLIAVARLASGKFAYWLGTT